MKWCKQMKESQTGQNNFQLEQIVCPICEGSRTKSFLRGASERIVRCLGCGLIYVNPRRTSQKVNTFFEEEYIPDEARLKEKFTNTRAPALAMEAEIIKRYKPRGRILDVGCAGGEFLQNFLNLNWICEGVEPSTVAAETAHALGIDIYQGALQDISLEKAHYDVITVIDTLFFTAWPLENLRIIHHGLKADGVLAVEYPGFTFRMARNIGPISLLINGRWIHMDENSPHLFYFSSRTIRKLLDKAGFIVVSEHPIPSPDYGGRLYRMLIKGYYYFSWLLFKISFGKMNLAPKTLLICRKQDNCDIE